MIKFIFLINIFISVIISQVIPEHLTNIVKIDQIPETVPTVYVNQKNINFLKNFYFWINILRKYLIA